MYRTAFNTTTGPVVVDDAGRTIGGGEWGTIETTTDSAKAALDAGQLVLVSEDQAEGAAGETARAFKRTAETAARAEELKDREPDELHRIAVKAGILDEDAERPAKATLVDEIARRPDVDIPAQRGRKTAAKDQET